MTIIIVLTVAMKITMMLIILNKQLKSYSQKFKKTTTKHTILD